MSRILFDGTSLEKVIISDDSCKILPDGGPGGKPAIAFDNKLKTDGEFELDLSDLDIDFKEYDQLHFDYFQENGVTDLTVTFRGYPDDLQQRRWYSVKRFPIVDGWDHIRYELDLDDDGTTTLIGDPLIFDEQMRKLIFNFKKSPENSASELHRIRARITNVRLVKTPINITIDTRKIKYEKTEKGIFFHHPVKITNRADRQFTAKIEVLPQTLAEFQVKEFDQIVSLEKGENHYVNICLWISKEKAQTLPVGYAERGLVRCTIDELPGYNVLPLRAQRPVYLLGIIPPEEPNLALDFGEWDEKNRKKLETSLDWKYEAPLDVVPGRPDVVCPKCRKSLRALDMYNFVCPNTECPNNKGFTVTKDDYVFRTYLYRYHIANTELAKQYALAYRATNDTRYGNKALDILCVYAGLMDKLPMVNQHSIAWSSRLAGSVLFELRPLRIITEAFLLMKDTELITPEQYETIRDDLVLELWRVENNFLYGRSAGQISKIASSAKYMPALGYWYYLADMLVGDGGWNIMLDRAFDVDGVAVEGGVYAHFATLKAVNTAEALKQLGLSVDEERINRIVRNNMAVGFYAENDPKPSWYEGTEPESVVLTNTGFTVLINGKNENWRKATINWGSNRDRKEHDLMSYDFLDNSGLLISETGRIRYSSQYVFFMTASFAHNVPVVDEQDISMERKVQEYFYSGADSACCLIADTAETPAYPNARVSRAIVLVEGFLLAIDRVMVNGSATIDKVIYGFGNSPAPVLDTSITDLRPWKDTLGKSRVYSVPWELNFAEIKSGFNATWSRESRKNGKSSLHISFLGDNVLAFKGKTRGEISASERPFLMVRKRGDASVFACLYERTRGNETQQIKVFSKMDVTNVKGDQLTDDSGTAYRIELNDGKKIDVLVSFDGQSYIAGKCRVDDKKRIDVNVIK